MQCRRPTEREDGEAPRIDSAAHRDESDALGHVRIDDPIDTLGRRHSLHTELVRYAIDGSFGSAAVEARATAEKVVRVEEAKHEVGVGHRRLSAAIAIAGRTRLRAGTLRPDVEHTAVVYARDRAATRADAGDVQALQRHPLTGNAPVRRNRRLTADH